VMVWPDAAAAAALAAVLAAVRCAVVLVTLAGCCAAAAGLIVPRRGGCTAALEPASERLPALLDGAAAAAGWGGGWLIGGAELNLTAGVAANDAGPRAGAAARPATKRCTRILSTAKRNERSVKSRAMPAMSEEGKDTSAWKLVAALPSVTGSQRRGELRRRRGRAWRGSRCRAPLEVNPNPRANRRAR